jgi:class 3 adenylate cyclase/protein-S-isoprenylcysteine O-methyltransferase Ste14
LAISDVPTSRKDRAVNPDAVVHRLTAILSSDAVGYSRLLAEDEVATVRTLQVHREHIAALVRHHRGRVVDSPGDNLLAEFPSALDAARCAAEIQRAVGARNADVPPHRRMEFRIGVHLGDVMVEGDRIYGEGINIAARLERLADPGAVCVSATVWDQVRNKLGLSGEDLGDQTLKNIPEPVRVYQIRPTEEAARPSVTRRNPEALPGGGFLGRPDVSVIVVPTVWIVYVATVFEILFMISPFALYYYAAYGPSLNVLHRSPWTSWLTDFLLPHFSYTSSRLLNALPDLGGPLIAVGGVLFAVGFVQVYGAKVRGSGLVTGGLYRVARHPQYLGLALVGLGAFLVWPRVLVLVAYVTMLFLYERLAGGEETRCLAKFGDAYRAYQRRTGMFLPRPLPRLIPWPPPGERRVLAALMLWLVVVAATVGVGYQVRDYALRRLSAFYTEDMAVLSPARLLAEPLHAAVRVAMSAAEVRDRIGATGPRAKLLVYVLPEAWRIADLPLDAPSSAAHASTDRGHHVPFDFDPVRYRVLVTRVRSHDPDATGAAIVKRAYGREPIVAVRVNTQTGAITGIETPPPHVLWGDISTPLF